MYRSIKIFGIILTIVSIIFSYSACSNEHKQNEKGNERTNTIVTKPVERVEGPTVTLNYLTKNVHIVNSYKDSEVDKICDEITNLCLSIMNINLQFHFAPDISSYGSYVQEAIASGDKVDFCDAVYVLEDMSHDIINEYDLADITDFLTQYYPYVVQIIEESPQTKDKIELDNRIYAVPGRKRTSVNNLYCVVTDKKIFKKSKMKNISNFLEYIDYYNICVEKELFKQKKCIECDINLFIQLYLECFGYNYLDFGLIYSPNDKAVIPMENAPEFLDAYMLYTNMLQEGYITYESEQNRNPHNNNNLPVPPAYTAQPVPYGNLIDNNELAFESFKDDYEIFLLNENSSYYISYFIRPKYYIPNNGDIENSLKVMNFIQTSQAANDLFRYGLKDTNYYLKKDKVCLYDYETTAIDWRSSFYYSPELERPFISEIETGFDIRRRVMKNIPYDFDKFWKARANLYRTEWRNINDFSKIRSGRNAEKKIYEKQQLYSKLKKGLSVEDYIDIIQPFNQSYEIDDFVNHFNEYLK